MNIYESAVRKPISTALIFIGVVVFGLYSLFNIAIDQYPEIDIPMISVITTYQGASASDIETNVTRILEDNLNTVDNLTKISSDSQDNYSLISLEFEYGIDMSEAANDVRDAVGLISTYLPDGASYPIILKISSSMAPIMMLAVTADESYPALSKTLDEKLVNTLNRIDGVGAVTLMGAPERQVQVNVDPRKIDAYGLSVESIGQIIQMENVNISAGTIDVGNNTINVKSDGEFSHSRQIRDIVVSNDGGRTIRLKDIAEVKDTLETSTMDERINGELAVRVIIQKQTGANTVNIVDKINEELPKIQTSLPRDVEIVKIYESSEEIIDSINSLKETIMYAFIFVALVVMVFLGRWRAAFIICLTIPISLICSFIYLFAVGSTINIISLSSLSIAIGMVVDDAIVVLENIENHIKRGSSPMEAAIYATNEVWLSVIATTLVVVAVFMPLTMVPGMAGIMFRELGWIVSIVVCVSTAAAITLTPMLSAYMLKADGGVHDYKGLGVIYKPIDMALAWLDRAYARMLEVVLSNRRITALVIVMIFSGAIYLLGAGKIATEFFPPSDNARISAVVKLDQNLSVDYTAKVARQIDSIIYAKYPEAYVLSTSSGANSSDDAFAALQTTGSYIINYNMRLESSIKRDRTIFAISDLLREDLDQIPEIHSYEIIPGGSNASMSGSSTVDVNVFGSDLDEMTSIANDVMAKVKQIDGLRDVQLSMDDLRTEYDVQFDREKLSYYGLNYYTAAYYVSNRINGLTASIYREDGDEYDIVVRYAEEQRESIQDIENITLYTSTGGQIRLKDVADVVSIKAAPTISRENRERVIKVQGSMGDGVPLSKVTDEIKTLIAEYHAPDGITLILGGTIEDQDEAFADLGTLFLLIVILVYIVMATQFESLLFPFIIMFTIPLAFTGVIYALYVTGIPLSLIALIGSIMLVGIVTKNGIVMIDYMNLLIERGSSVRDAVIEGGISRLRPVLMTSFTTILGMTPMAMGVGSGSETWQPMGVAVIGGLVFSTLLTLLVVPVLYSIFMNRKISHEKRKQALQDA
ncbi:MAG: efflux RND transporter permease subunit [Rikenellaceae bacterium]